MVGRRDAAKWNSALSLYYQMKFANTMQSLAMLALTPDEQPMAAYIKPLTHSIPGARGGCQYNATGAGTNR